MKKERFENLYPSIIEKKLLNLLKNNYPELLIFGWVILPKRRFNFLTSLIRFSPEEVLGISKGFSNLKISNNSTKFVKVSLNGMKIEPKGDCS